MLIYIVFSVLRHYCRQEAPAIYIYINFCFCKASIVLTHTVRTCRAKELRPSPGHMENYRECGLFVCAAFMRSDTHYTHGTICSYNTRRRRRRRRRRQSSGAANRTRTQHTSGSSKVHLQLDYNSCLSMRERECVRQPPFEINELNCVKQNKKKMGCACASASAHAILI